VISGVAKPAKAALKATQTVRSAAYDRSSTFVNVPHALSPVQTVERLSGASEIVRSKTDMSVLIPALNEGENLATLLPWLRRILEELDLSYEVIVVTSESDQGTIEAAVAAGARVLFQVSKGYGGALIDGVRASRGEYILTLDADLSHRPDFVREMWNARHAAEITIASRYVPGGTATMPRYRLYLSRVLNVVFRRGLSMPLRDLSSGFRLYLRSVIDPDALRGTDFDLLQEILVRAYCEGWKVQEIPFDYMPREYGSSSARLTRLGKAYLRSFWRLWKLRNSLQAADYDYRAFQGPVPLQRYWQRSRLRIVGRLTTGQGPVLDVGCGSSRILGSLPEGSVGLDILMPKLRYSRRFGLPLVQASGFQLPFPDASFSCVLSSQVIGHVPKDSPLIDELWRVLKPGGRLVLGTPDYSRWEWVYLEKLYERIVPGAADGHTARYTRTELLNLLERKGLTHEATCYIARAELIMAFRRPAHASTAQ
jgi:dolichol-phosphate mannosyltransferase